MSDSAEGGSSAGRMTTGMPTSSPALHAAAMAATATATAAASTAAAASCDPQCCDCAGGTWSFDDEPPSYASLITDPDQSAQDGHNPNHRPSWSYVFQTYEAENVPDHRAFARPLVHIPLTSYRIFKIEPPCYAAATRQLPPQRIVAELAPTGKSSSGSARKYSAILIAATVIIFLMALSLMVRLVTEKSFWKG